MSGMSDSESALAQLRADVAALVEQLTQVAVELKGINEKLDRLEKVIREIALGLGVRP